MASSTKAPPTLETLPYETLLQIFSCLPRADLHALAASSSVLRSVATSDSIWSRQLAHVLSSSPASHSHNLTPLVDPPAAWDPAFGLIGPHAPANQVEWPLTRSDAEAVLPACPHRLPRSTFEGAESLWQVWCFFVRPWTRLLGWWAADVPAYGFVMRIVYDATYLSSSSSGGEKEVPAFICQKVHLVNRLQGMTPPQYAPSGGEQKWSEATSFAMPLGVGVSRDGASLRGQLNLDLSAPGIKTETLWCVTWTEVRDALRNGARKQVLPTRAWATTEEDEALTAVGERRNGPQLDDELQASSSSSSSSTPALDAAAQPTSLDSEPPPAAGQRVISTREGYQHVTHIASSAISTTSLQAPLNTPVDAVRLHLHSFLPYAQTQQPAAQLDTQDLAPALAALVDARRRAPMPVLPFPTKALLPGIRALDGTTRGVDEEEEEEEEEPRVDALLMAPAPPYRPWPHLAPPLKAGPRFFPLKSPPRTSVCTPSRRAVRRATSEGGSEEASAEEEDGDGETTFIHTPPPPRCDPAEADFDWRQLEGLYATTYGPWGLELIYVRSRLVTHADFEATSCSASLHLDEEATYRRAAEPLLSTAEMYVGTQIDVPSVQVGVRIVEGVKVSGDPHVPRGQVTFRAFVDDPASVATAWRAPGRAFANHTPWPFRAPLEAWEREAGREEAEKTPGLVCPGHGRLAGEGFVAPGWVSSIVQIASPDLIRIWWSPMMSVATCVKLTGC